MTSTASPLQGSPRAARRDADHAGDHDEADVLRDEGEAYAAKLRAAGVDITAVRVAGIVHDFLMLDSLRDCRATVVARELAIAALRKALSG